ncbi:DUF1295 domain-containing protein [Streptomyces sp. NPDC094143]|uniref:DUF1295 domain-containing protein n=1 Tax=Streptomyces sp. NPDC094143 TaxID=3155310 RepID=UPI003331C0A5
MSSASWAAFDLNAAVSAAAALAVMLLTFTVALRLRLHRIVDIAWGLAFTAVASVSYLLSAGEGNQGRRLLVTLATCLWGLRLAAHIAWRGRGHGEDAGYTRLLDRAHGNRNLYALRTVYLLQAFLVWLVSLPIQAAQYVPAPVGPLAVAGALLWAAGLTFEATGDYQLARFKADPGNRGRVMDRGLWAWTRHPNYFGDALLWWGMFLLACATWQTAVLTFVSPLTMTMLLTCGSGKRLLETHMTNRPGYVAYQARTSGYLPRPPRRRARSGPA